jgi:transposase
MSNEQYLQPIPKPAGGVTGSVQPGDEVPVRNAVPAGGVERGRSPSGTEPAGTALTPRSASGATGFVSVAMPEEAEGPEATPPAEGAGPAASPADVADGLPLAPPLSGRSRQRGRRLVKPAGKPEPLSAEQRLLVLDTWQRSGLPASDFAAMVGICKSSLFAWKKRFEEQGPAGLIDQPKGGPRGSRLPDLTVRTILMLKKANPEYGCQRISDLLLRGPALPASPTAVARVLHEAGYQLEEVPTRPHPDKVRFFERANANQLWQTDLFTFILKRQNRRVYLVAFLDDHSRFIVGYGLHASQSSALVLEVLRAALGSYGVPA